MPVKLGSKLSPEPEARIEIIPLIDIMFFLLAAFMLVSLSMVQIKSVKVDLPTATTATRDSAKQLVNLSVAKSGLISLEGKPIGPNELAAHLAAAQQSNPGLRVLISGDHEASHGAIIRALDLVRRVGIDKVGFEIRPQESTSTPSQP